ncbi:helix-turn-helix domain-containing protein [Amycolatopsis sp. NPDC058986]|uniref:helix-turn-helix domain-containing protein n=1 Tax=unclassified Amycolatopsis TaxID=2618356 RepID=UPI003672361A
MPDENTPFDPDIGMRIRELRRMRGMGLRVTAELAGLSPSFLSMVEKGDRTLDRFSHIVTVATALRVPVGDLIGLPQRRDSNPVKSRRFDADLSGVRLAITEPSSMLRRTSWTGEASELASRIDRAIQSRLHTDAIQLLQRLPVLIAEVRGALSSGRRQGRTELLRQQARLYREVCSPLLLSLGAKDLGIAAYELGKSATRRLDDPLDHATATYRQAEILSILHSYDTAAKIAEEAIEKIGSNPRHGHREKAIRYILHSQAAFAHARGGDIADAVTHLDESKRYFAALDHHHWALVDRPEAGSAYASLNRMYILFHRGLFKDVVNIGERLRLTSGISFNLMFHCVLGCSYAQLPGHEESAVRHLTSWREAAPARLGDDDEYVKQAVTRLASRPTRGKVSRQIHDLAAYLDA